MCKILLPVVMLLVITAHAQQIFVPNTGYGPYRRGQTLNESPLLPVHKSSVVRIAVDIDFDRSVKYFVKGLMKATAVSAFAYKANSELPAGTKFDSQNRVGISLPLGMGVATGATDLVHFGAVLKSPKVIYSFYDTNKKLLSRECIKWKGPRSLPIKVNAEQDGFLQVTVISGTKKIKRAGQLQIDIQHTNALTETPISMDNGGEGGGGGTIDPDEEPDIVVTDANGNEISFYDRDNDGQIDGYSYYSDIYGVVVGNLVEYGSYNTSNIGDVMQDYNPPQWEDLEEYMDYYDYYYNAGTEPTLSTDTIKNNVINRCLNAPVNNILNSPTNTIKQLIGGVFSSSGSFHLSINEAYGLSYNSAAQTNLLDNDLILIELSRLELDYATQEYVTAIVLHEMIHAYLLTQPNCPTDRDGQHEYMIQNFTTTIANALQQLFPGMSNQTAIRLALGGYTSLQNTTMWSNAMATYNVSTNDVNTTNIRQKNGLDGTPCQ